MDKSYLLVKKRFMMTAKPLFEEAREQFIKNKGAVHDSRLFSEKVLLTLGGGFYIIYHVRVLSNN